MDDDEWERLGKGDQKIPSSKSIIQIDDNRLDNDDDNEENKEETQQ